MYKLVFCIASIPIFLIPQSASGQDSRELSKVVDVIQANRTKAFKAKIELELEIRVTDESKALLKGFAQPCEGTARVITHYDGSDIYSKVSGELAGKEEEVEYLLKDDSLTVASKSSKYASITPTHRSNIPTFTLDPLRLFELSNDYSLLTLLKLLDSEFVKIASQEGGYTIHFKAKETHAKKLRNFQLDIDSSAGHLPIAFRAYDENDQLSLESRCKYSHKDGVWFPDSWESKIFRGTQLMWEERGRTIAFELLPDNTPELELTFGPNVYVVDGVRKEVYRTPIQADKTSNSNFKWILVLFVIGVISFAIFRGNKFGRAE